PRCKMRLKKRLLAFSRRLHARIRKTRYMHKMRCLLINRRSLLLALRLLWKTPIFPSNSRFPRLCAKCLLKRSEERFSRNAETDPLSLHDALPISEMQNETQKEIAGIQSATSRQNTKDQVYAQNEMLAYQQKESTARVASIMENTNLSKQQQVSEIMRQMLTQAQTAGQYF